MIKTKHLMDEVIIPTLKYLTDSERNMNSENAHHILIGTCMQESDGGYYLDQLSNGGARGIFQMERRTHDDIWENVLKYDKPFHSKMMGLLLMTDRSYEGCFEQLAGNLYYATAMARIQYWRQEEELPDSDDIKGIAQYWKKYYNTEHGSGTVDQFIANYDRVANILSYN